MCPIFILNKLQSSGRDKNISSVIVAIFTLVFATICGLFTMAKRHEIFAATAAWGISNARFGLLGRLTLIQLLRRFSCLHKPKQLKLFAMFDRSVSIERFAELIHTSDGHCQYFLLLRVWHLNH